MECNNSETNNQLNNQNRLEISLKGKLGINPSEQLSQSNENQQNKIISSLNYGDFNILSQKDVKVNFTGREVFFENVRNNKININSFKELLSKITPPINIEGPELIFSKVADNKNAMWTVANFIKGDVSLMDSVNQQDLINFSKKYPDPISLDEDLTPFIKSISEVKENSSETINSYIDSMKQFKKDFYGKRFEYAEQIKILTNEAFSGRGLQSKEKNNDSLFGHYK